MDSQHIAKFLRQIPQSNQDAIAIEQISRDLNPDIAYGYALMLQNIGMVQLTQTRYIKASSQTAKYTIESLASYVENDLRWIDDWKTRGVHRDTTTGVLQNGATLLHELEMRRIDLLENPAPSRVEEVVQVLIKRTNPETNTPEFLMQYDQNADQYQFIGGRRSPNDDTLQIAIIREIEEEIATYLAFGEDYKLAMIVPDMIVPATLSPTFGALTEYHFTIYHMTNLSKSIELTDHDAWVPVKNVLNGIVKANGRTAEASDTNLYQQMNASIEGGMQELDDSFRI